jgi:hypothetical protein
MRDYGNTNAAWIGATAPTATPEPGQLWWRNDPDGNLYISYNDGTSTQWVPAVPVSKNLDPAYVQLRRGLPGQSIPSSTYTYITFDTTVASVGGLAPAPPTDTVTIVTTGLYIITASWTAITSGGTWIRLRIWTAANILAWVDHALPYPYMSAAATAWLTAGTQVRLQIYSTATTTTVPHTSEGAVDFAVTKVA